MRSLLAGQRLNGPGQGHCSSSYSSTRIRARAACAAGVRGRTTHERSTGPSTEVCDLVLSSGFLAFAGHAGFLQAVEEMGVPVGGVMGTSAGALVGSLYCAGYSPLEVAKHLSDQTPASLLRPSAAPWRGGALSLDGVISRLRDLLPPRFEDLQREFAVGVVTAEGEHLLIDSGPLPEAVAASAAIPIIFQAVDVPGHVSRHGPFKDGGVVDRVGLKAWRDRRRAQISKQLAAGDGNAPLRPPTCLVHVIDRSSPFSGFDDMTATGESHILVVKSPRSGANFFDLGSFGDTMAAAHERARHSLLASSAAAAVGPSSRTSSRPAAGAASSAAAASIGNGHGHGNGNGHGAVNGATAPVTSTAPTESAVRATTL
ncbi:hypothetical protein CHLRE_10g417750v5 [Chlamydomonas reinhardtii]|uniref:Patatin n=1 Tax=Chlamydomonas reinhardtii TaxID=3055 RepID=A0A2K3D8Y0_CHLRE|nr:uncharacterized protein CHLRE_10g417750v5 [Chlamydomonas reinhardtii]PNW76990.1 hypothetical protein CHLRE_10g417750v5 [Chlamydomonas reinhardtii]